MADIVTGTVTGSVDTSTLQSEHADIRREGAIGQGEVRYDVAQAANETVKESIKGDWNVERAVKDARHDNIIATDSVGDRLSAGMTAHDSKVADRFFQVGRDTADLRAQVIQAIDTVKMSTEMNGLKAILAAQQNTAYLGDKIGSEGEKTRALINELKYNDLNRALIERNTELVEERHGRNHWRHVADQAQFQGQWATLQSQIQAFQSQLQETRQGMVNFGTMAGVGQSSTSNNVR